MKKYTDGNWEVEYNTNDTNFYGKVFSQSAETDICEAYDWDNDTESIANLNLISAAPDLLETLILIQSKIENAAKERANYVIEQDDIFLINHAVAKALR